MNYTQQPGQNTTNPADLGSNEPFNFMGQGVGSNQYGGLPPWMNTSMNYSAGGSGYGGGGGGGPMQGGYTGSPQGSPYNTGLSISTPYNQGYQPNYGIGPGQPAGGFSGAGGGPIWGGGPFSVVQPQYPNLSQGLANYLGSQIGQGEPAYTGATALPFGGQTRPGQLTAQENPLNMSLFNFYQGGQSNIPGANTLATIANQGISALPEWQAMVGAMGQNIASQEAQAKEQFAGMGGLAGSPYASAESNLAQGITAQQNALLGQLQQQNILQGQIPVAEGLLGGATQFGQYAQAQQQQAIQNQYQDWLRQLPQNNPLLQYQYGMATTYPPTLTRPSGGGFLSGLM